MAVLKQRRINHTSLRYSIGPSNYHFLFHKPVNIQTIRKDILLPYFLLLISCTLGSRSIVEAFDASLICSRIEGLLPKQRIICRSHPDAMAAIGQGTRQALMECQHQFRNDRWNCQPLENVTRGSTDPLVGVALSGSRESAFVYAIRSAGITHGITAACSRGEMQACGCDRSRSRGRGSSVTPRDRLHRSAEGDWTWGGCSADIRYGIQLSRAYVDGGEIKEESQALVNLHNNRVGRQALRRMVGLSCKCHGVSGSCTSRTCWTTLPQFRQVGDRLSLTYDRARQVEPIRGERARKAILLKLRRSPKSRRRSADDGDKKPPRGELVYLKSSPDYCEHAPERWSVGTRGRACNRTSSGTDGCKHLCCGRGFDARIQWTESKCNCKFHWCCHVTCDKCSTSVELCTCR